MTPQQFLDDVASLGRSVESRVQSRVHSGMRCAGKSLPTLAGLAVAIASSVVLTLAGCASSAGIAPVAKPIEPASIGLDVGAAATPPIAADWWRAFGDPALDGLVERALVGSPNLRVTEARLARAESVVAGARGNAGARLNAEVDLNRQHLSRNALYPPPYGGTSFTTGNLQLNGGYDFDFFGRNRAAIESANGTRRAAEADVAASRQVLAVNVARSYLQIGRLFAQREVASRSLQQRDAILGLIRQRVQGGLDTNVELRQGEAALPEAREQIEQLDEQIALGRHALAALVAAPPTAFDDLVVSLRAVQAVPVPANVPADLLGRRPDIAAARWRVEAASRDVQGAKAGFYPNVNLTAAFALNAIGLDNVLLGSSRQWLVGPAITLPIFDAGRLRANLQGRTADLDAAIESYNVAVLDAVHDAADQISSVRSVARQQDEQAKAETLAESAYDLATQRYRAGLGTYLTVLNAEVNVLAQHRLATDLRARAIDTQVTLIRALGGGYVETAPAAIAASR